MSKIKRNQRGLSPVVASVILAAAVISIGGMVWGFAQSAMVSVADSYVEGIMNLKDECVERFTIEHVGYIRSNNTLRIWIYNYGANNITVDYYIEVEGGSSTSLMGVGIASKTVVRSQVSIIIAVGKEVSIKAVSRRGNNVYFNYLCP